MKPNIALPKWPGLVVVGNPVSRRQAQEILIRTSPMYVSTNDREWEKQVYSTFGIDFELVDGWFVEVNHESIRKIEKELGVINLHYLQNRQIASCYIGGPYGWCDWYGNIGCNSYNIGKWPSTEDVYDDWESIAKTFPYLELECQLSSKETCNTGVPLIQYSIANGEVSWSIPTEFIRQPESMSDAELISCFTSRYRERGCPIEVLQEAVELVRGKLNSCP